MSFVYIFAHLWLRLFVCLYCCCYFVCLRLLVCYDCLLCFGGGLFKLICCLLFVNIYLTVLMVIGWWLVARCFVVCTWIDCWLRWVWADWCLDGCIMLVYCVLSCCLLLLLLIVFACCVFVYVDLIGLLDYWFW